MESKYYVVGYYCDWIQGPMSLKEATKLQHDEITLSEPAMILMEVVDKEGKAVK